MKLNRVFTAALVTLSALMPIKAEAMSFFWSDSDAVDGMGLRFQQVRRDPNVNNRLWMEMWYEDGRGRNFTINPHMTGQLLPSIGVEISDVPIYCDGKTHQISSPDGTVHTFTGFKEYICNAFTGHTTIPAKAFNRDYYNSVVLACRIEAERDARWLENLNDCLVNYGYYPVSREIEMYYVFES